MAQTGRRGDAQEFNAQALAKQIVEAIGTDYKRSPIRKAYEKAVSNLAREKARLLKQGLSSKRVARVLWQARRDLGKKYKDQTPWPLTDFIYERNERKYGDPLGPGWQTLEAKYSGDYNQIIDASMRYNSNIDGVLAGFPEWLAQQPQDYLLRAARDFLGHT